MTDKTLVQIFAMKALQGALKLEIKGMKKRGQSAYSIIKKRWNLRGNRQRVLDQFTEIYETTKLENLGEKRDDK